jgi:hypothetical protein
VNTGAKRRQIPSSSFQTPKKLQAKTRHRRTPCQLKDLTPDPFRHPKSPVVYAPNFTLNAAAMYLVNVNQVTGNNPADRKMEDAIIRNQLFFVQR